MSDTATQPLTEAAFFAWLERQERRFELVSGQPRAMVGGTLRHDTICGNAMAALRARLRGRCRVWTADVAVRIPGGNLRYPDVTVDCGTPQDDARTAIEPRLVVEVLSRSTSEFDQTEKLEEYRSVPSLAHVVIVDPAQPQLRLHSRGADGVWSSAPHVGLDAQVALTALDITVPLSELYDGLTFRPRPRLVEDPG
jgi:Uma2 family endonuclease